MRAWAGTKVAFAVKVAKTHEWRQELRGIVAPFRVKQERATKESQRVRCARHKTFVHVPKMGHMQPHAGPAASYIQNMHL